MQTYTKNPLPFRILKENKNVPRVKQCKMDFYMTINRKGFPLHFFSLVENFPSGFILISPYIRMCEI